MLQRIKTGIIGVCVIFLAWGCQTTKNFYSKQESDWEEREIPNEANLEHTIYLIGDAGAPSSDPLEPALALLKKELEASDQENTSVVFLGDNIYDRGLHKKKHPKRADDERKIQTQMDILQNFEGRIVFLPGNHDWQNGNSKGDHYVKRQEKYIEKYLDRGNIFLPDEGCPGPVEIELSERLIWVIIDTQWWLHPYDRPEGDQDGCDVYNNEEYILQLEDILKKNQNKQIIISGHHPLHSNGNHGGYFSAKDHLFPLTKLSKNLWIPLPIIGSIYPLYRSVLGNIQDIPHPKYTALVNGLTDRFDLYEDVVYTSGHEHNLQYQKHGTAHFVVSGSGSKTGYLRNNSDLQYGKSDKGFAALKYYSDGSLWLECFVSDLEEPITFRKQIRDGHRHLVLPEGAAETLTIVDSLITVVPGGEYYEGGKIREAVMGSLYRDVWTAPIQVPVIDISKEYGGLVPIKRGGGMQSKSLRLEAKNGREYVLRSIQKFPATILPKDLQNTFVKDIIQDVIAASHPYASITVPTMADAAGVYHTNPRLVYLPDDPALGQFREEFGGLLCLFEEHPKGDQSDMASFGYSEEVESTPKMIENLAESYHHRVDGMAMLRARLFDLVIGDWDRHDDQWRWASFEEGKDTYYKPIPRDRDQVYYMVNGIVPHVVNRKWQQRRFQPFEEDIKDMRGMNFNGQYVDRAYLSELEWKDWEAMCDTLQTRLTDDVFLEALALFPDTARKLHNDRIFETLKIHREKLKVFAREYYLILAEDVDVVGSFKDEYFEVERIDNQHTRVAVYPRKKKKRDEDHLIYQRTFLTNETDEIRLYGIGGEDVFHVYGEVKKGPLVRLIGGSDTDKYIDSSNVAGLKHHLDIYDVREKKKKKRNKLKVGKDAAVNLAKDEDDAVIYDRKAFHYDVLAPLISLGFNPDDGVFLGGGFSSKTYGFNKNPFKAYHKLSGSYAIATGAFQFEYEFEYRNIFKSKWNFAGLLDVQAPDFVFNYFGAGNETEFLTDDFRDNRLRINFVEFEPMFSRKSDFDVHTFRIGPTLQMVFPPEEIFEEISIGLPDAIRELEFENQTYLGLKAGYELNNADSKISPHRGIRFLAEASWTKGVDDTPTEFVRLKSELSLYMPFSFFPDRATLALRSGITANLGDYRFFQSNFIGGLTEMRGYRRNRFAGDVAFYNNAELRFRVLDFNNYNVPVHMGVMGFFDVGRVWLEGENSDIWHASTGGGLYFNIIDFAVLSTTYGVSRNDEIFLVQLGFFF